MLQARALDFGVNPAQAVDPSEAAPGRRVWLDVEDAPGAGEELARRFSLAPNALLSCRDASSGASALDGTFYIGLKALDDAWVSVLVQGDLLVTLRSGEIRALDEARRLLLDPRRGRRVSERNATYLAALILERVVDTARERLDALSGEVEELEERSTRGSRQALAERTVELQRAILQVERVLHGGLRAVADLQASEAEDLESDAVPVLQRVAAQAEDLLGHAERSRAMVTNVLNLHLAAVSTELNETIRLLTVVATLILVPTLIAGVYGMNFREMPLLDHPWGFPAAMGLMALSTLAVYGLFRARGFIGPRGRA